VKTGPGTFLTGVTRLMNDVSSPYDRPTCAVRSDGTAWCWGVNTSPFGGAPLITGAPPASPAYHAYPIVVSSGGPSLSGVDEITVGLRHLCAITTVTTPRDSVYCWGEGSAGQLGSIGSSLYPVLATHLPPGPRTNVAGGYDATCVLVGGQAYCFGANDRGQAGTGYPSTVMAGCSSICENSDPATPVLAGPAMGAGGPPLMNVAALHMGYSWVCARLVDGSVSCWGDDLGTGSNMTTYQAVPLVEASMPVTGVLGLTSYGTSGGYPNAVRYLTSDGVYHQAAATLPFTCPLGVSAGHADVLAACPCPCPKLDGRKAAKIARTTPPLRRRRRCAARSGTGTGTRVQPNAARCGLIRTALL
jgi:hypothetical protein